MPAPTFTYRPMRENQISVYEAWLGGSFKARPRERDAHYGYSRPIRPGRCTKCQEFLEYGTFTFTNEIRRRFGQPPISFCITCHEQIRETGNQLIQYLPPDLAAMVPAWPKPPAAAIFTRPEAATYPVQRPTAPPVAQASGLPSPDPTTQPPAPPDTADEWKQPAPDLFGIAPQDHDQ